MSRLAPLLLLLLLIGCGSRFDTEQTRLCRLAIPALNPPGTQIAVGRAGDGIRPNALRLHYTASRPGGAARARTIDCLFANAASGQARAPLIGIASDGEPMAEASFYLLRRFYLENRDEPPRDPGAPRPDAAIPVPPTAALAMQHVAAGLPSAAVYALIASAYALIHGLTGRIVLAFGEFAALGAFAAVVGVALAGLVAGATPLAGLAVALVVGTLVAGFHGYAMGRSVLRPLEGASRRHVLIATIGLAIAASEFLRLMQGPSLRWLPPVLNDPLPLARAGDFLVTVTPVGFAMAAIGLGASAALVLLIATSAYGRQWRAVADDPVAAALFGIDARAVRDRAMMLGCACCGLAGVIVTVIHGGMGFAGGFALGLKALVAAVLGGIGSVSGACLGALAIAAFETAWSATLPIEQRDLAVYSLLAIVLILKPGGFFGDSAPHAHPIRKDEE